MYGHLFSISTQDDVQGRKPVVRHVAPDIFLQLPGAGKASGGCARGLMAPHVAAANSAQSPLTARCEGGVDE